MMRLPSFWPVLLMVALGGCAMEARAPMEEAAAVASPTAMPSAPAPEMAKADMAPASGASANRAPPAVLSLLSAGDEGGKGGADRRRADHGAAKVGRAGGRGSPAKNASAEPAGAAKPKRMVHYNGNLRLKVTNASDVLNHAAKDCEEMGGYVESLTVDTVILRVPLAEFRPLYAKLLGLGEVMARSISAQDVTDAFTAMELRARILKASRDRLVALLAKATTARAKLDLLAEIRSLTEEIDQLDRYLTQMQSLAQFSRITLSVEVKTVAVETRAQEVIAAFKWIHDLSPFKQGVAAANKRLELEVPKGMVKLDRDDLWIAESADGARVWASQNKLGPEGSTDFWIDAVKYRLGPEYVSAEISTVGKFKVLRLLDEASDTSYRYLVAVRAEGKRLLVVEAYFMNAEQEKRYGTVVREAIERGES